MKNVDGKDVQVVRRIYCVDDIYRNKESGKLWRLAFILPEGYMLEDCGFHTRPLTSEELHARFEYVEPPKDWAPPTTLYL